MSVNVNGIEFSDDLKTLIKCPPDKIGKDVIFIGVTEIGEGAFEGCTDLFEINIPEGVKKIGDRAFFDCEKLKEVIIPESVIEIGDCVFPKHTKILVMPQFGVSMYPRICDYDPEEISRLNWHLIPYYTWKPYVSGVLFLINEELFSYGDTPLWDWSESFEIDHLRSADKRLDFVRRLKNLTMFSENPDYTVIDGVLFDKDVKTLIFCPKWKTGKYIIPASVTKIYDEAFYKCEQLSEVECPNTLEEIGFRAFAYSSIIKICIPDSVNKIVASAFKDCKNLTEIEIPDSVTEIGTGAFENCEMLAELIIPEHITDNGFSIFDDGAFSLCKGCKRLTKFHIPNGVKKIGTYAFDGCERLVEIQIPDSVTEIGRRAFADCRSLTEIKLPEGITKIGEYAFLNCKKLTDIKFPDGAEIGKNVFDLFR
jgi:hypothetical protein